MLTSVPREKDGKMSVPVRTSDLATFSGGRVIWELDVDMRLVLLIYCTRGFFLAEQVKGA